MLTDDFVYFYWSVLKMVHKTSDLVSQLVLWAQSTKMDYIRAEHEFQSVSMSLIPQVIISQVFVSQITAQILSTISDRKTRKKQ